MPPAEFRLANADGQDSVPQGSGWLPAGWGGVRGNRNVLTIAGFRGFLLGMGVT